MKVQLLAAVLVLTFAGCRQHEAEHNQVATGTAPVNATAPVAAPYDLQFLDTMTTHHQGAVDMAKMAEGKIVLPELKALVATIPADQQKEIDQMKAWREQWYRGQPSAENMQMPGMSESMMHGDHLATMTAGPAYDAMFIDMMIPHHEGAIVMAKEALTKAEHAELRTLAQNIIDAQTAEIAQMRQWRSQLPR